MPSISDTLNKITERIQATANSNTIYGEPVPVEGKTLIPVAKVRYGFGAGGKGGNTEDSGEQPSGAGGGVEITPVGVIEITDSETRYISLEGTREIVKYILIAATAIAIAVALRQIKR